MQHNNSSSAFVEFSYKNLSPVPKKEPKKPKIKLSLKLSIYLLDTFKKCDPNYNYDISSNPKRYLTQPAEGIYNGGFDNIENDYILRVNDYIISSKKQEEYCIIDFLGKGTFGQVVRCLHMKTNKYVAIKIIKNQPAYFHQGRTEIEILKKLNKFERETGEESRIVHLIDCFTFRKHLCLVFELLDISLFDLLKNEGYNGFCISDISLFTKQILEGLIQAEKNQIIHCDLKPENILFLNKSSSRLKIIDFGSACQADKTPYMYIQSRFYRAPEILLGMKYSLAIDLWSLGCICTELYLGFPIFPGNSTYDQIKKIIEVLGYPPHEILENSPQKSRYFNQISENNYVLKSKEQIEIDEAIKLLPSKKYHNLEKICDIEKYYPNSKFRNTFEAKMELQHLSYFIDFIKGLLKFHPDERISASKAINHPFITKPFQLGEIQNVFFPNDFEEKKNEKDEENLLIENSIFDTKNLNIEKDFNEIILKKNEDSNNSRFFPGNDSLNSANNESHNSYSDFLKLEIKKLQGIL